MKPSKIIFLFLLIFSSNLVAAASYHYDFNNRCQEAYKALSELRIEEGMNILEGERKSDPYNLIPVFLENYDDFLTILLTNDEQQYNLRKKNLDIRLSLLNKGPKNSPWYRYCKSSVNFQWAVLHIYFNSYLGAASEFRNSFLLLKENQKLFPNFKYNLILSGLEEAIVGTVPDSYQWISKLLGMQGSVKGGTAKLVRFLNDDTEQTETLQNDAVFYYCYVKFFLLSDRKEVWSYLNRHYPDVSNNLLLTFLISNLAVNDNKAALALQLMNDRNKGKNYLPVPMFDYQSGLAALRLMDARTPVYLKRFLQTNKGKVFVKSALQKLSYYYLVLGDTLMAQQYRKAILNQGNTLTDADKQAQRYATNNLPLPNKNLIAAELLCDGGNYKKALQSLTPLKPSELEDKEEQTAYFYRYGRIYQLMGNTKACLPFYKEAISIGQNLPGQFAARSALEIGHIYEDIGNKPMAIAFYRKCLNMDYKDFKANLDQKAKAGLNRLGA